MSEPTSGHGPGAKEPGAKGSDAKAAGTKEQALSLDAINELDIDEFVRVLGEIFEHSPWVAERAWQTRPFQSIAQLHRTMVEVVKAAGREPQLTLLRAHPQLAGKEAKQGTLTASSTSEQSSAGLNALSREQMAQIERWNAEYFAKFGFPFIIAVRNYTKRGIFREFERRLGNDPETEFGTCLDQVHEIGLIRLEALVTAG